MTSSLLDAALSYAARGWAVFPCRGKQPLGGLKWKEAATTDTEQIRVWWARWPGAQIGLPAGGNGLYIIDEDATDAAAHLELPPTLVSHTGKGRHLIYQRPEGEDGTWRNVKGQKPPKRAGPLGFDVDGRGDGGYVIAPPSVHHLTGKPYAWEAEDEPIAPLPDNVCALLQQAPIEATINTKLPPPRVERAPDVDVFERAGRYLSTVEGAISGAGGHDDTIRVACMLANGWALDRGDAWALLCDYNTRCQPPWSERELVHKLDDAIKDGTFGGRPRGCLLNDRDGGNLIERGRAWPAAAQAAGSSASDGASSGASGGAPSPFDQAIADLMAAGFGVKDTKEVRPLAFESTVGLFDEVFPETPWQIRGLMTERSLCVIGGEPKTTKTWAALEIAMAVATGTPAFGDLQTMKEPAAVALFMAEDSRRSTRNRLRALASSRGLDPRAACERIFATYLQAIDLRSIQHVASLVVAVRAIGPVGLIVLDPLRDCHGAEENSSTEMAVVAHAMRALRTVCSCSVQFIHHMGKGDPQAKGKRAGLALRGSTALHGAVDCGLYLRDLKTDKQTTWTNKAEVEVKGARGAGDFSLTWRVQDVDDEAVGGSWVLDREEAERKQAEAAKADLVLVDALVAALEAHITVDGGHRSMAGAFLQTHVKAGSAKFRLAVDQAVSMGLIARVREGNRPAGLVFVSRRTQSDSV